MGLGSCKHHPITPPDNNGNGGYSPRPCSPDTVYFQNEILPLLVSNCAMPGCHDAASHQEDVILTTYEKVMQTADIKPGQPSQSDLYEVIMETDPDKRMPPPPRPALSTAQKNKIKKWIEQGALNLSCSDCDTTNVTYTLTIKPLMDLKCNGCHSGSTPSANLNLTLYSALKSIALNGKLMGVISHQNGFSPMPKGGAKLPDCEIKAVDIWVKAGAPQN